MGLHLIGFYTASANPTAYTALGTISDNSMTQIDASHYKVPSVYRYMGSYMWGTILTKGRVLTPSLSSERVPIFIDDPDNTATHPALIYPPMHMVDDHPVPLKAGEAIEYDQITTGGGASPAFAGIWLADDNLQTVKGTLIPGVEATGATTVVAGAWTNCPLTFTQALPAGTYAIVGMRAIGATCMLARVVVPGYAWRMGVIGGILASNRGPGGYHFRNGDFGALKLDDMVSWGAFTNDTPPSVEFLCGAADTAQTVLFDLVKIA